MPPSIGQPSKDDGEGAPCHGRETGKVSDGTGIQPSLCCDGGPERVNDKAVHPDQTKPQSQ